MKLQIKKMREDAILPRYATEGAAGMDLCAAVDADLPPMGHALVPTGIALAVPVGYGAFLFARSGLAIKHGVNLRNGVGVVDSDYRGEVMVGLMNLSDKPYHVTKGERICQLVLIATPQAEIEVVEALSETLRGEGGFGSTGK